MAFIQPLDLQNLLVTTFAGSWVIFTFLAVIFIAAVAARFRMNNATFGIMLFLFSVLMAAWIPSIYIIGTIIASAIFAFIVVKLIKN